MKFDDTRQSFPWNSDRYCTQNLSVGGRGGGLGMVGGSGGDGVGGLISE